MTQVVLVHKGVVAEFEGKYWGVQYEDGRSTAFGYGPIQNAVMGDPLYLHRPTDMTYEGSHYTAELSKARLLLLTKTTVYEISL